VFDHGFERRAAVNLQRIDVQRRGGTDATQRSLHEEARPVPLVGAADHATDLDDVLDANRGNWWRRRESNPSDGTAGDARRVGVFGG